MFSDPIGVEHLFRHGICSALLICDGKATFDVLAEMHLLTSLGVVWCKDCHEGKLILILLGNRNERLDELSPIIAITEEYLGQWFRILEQLADMDCWGKG